MTPRPGTIIGLDLTVPEAARLRDFYADVVGWGVQGLHGGADYDDHDDYFMTGPDGTPVAGVCRREGENADLPGQWLVYIAVDDLAARVEKCVALGGAVVAGPKGEGPGAYCVIRDPAGAVLALMQHSGG
ncbi:VOC family protein [Actinomadura craniellae]|uniref:VOC family protein n=1 Tax=Actinomadura craniellae TaxID=2231787 RepID=A0A365GYY4_9ACTN|nr:VOC family protein [Actinomadura craniellae]RAY11143.1 VOC family protein [Actinomadura craniellae]